MTNNAKFHWVRVVLGILAAEALPILLLILVVVVYGVTAAEGSRSPEEFAPLAGNWVGPIGGFFATMFFAWWAARGAGSKQFAHGVAVGVGTALLDFSIGISAGGGEGAATVLILSNAGRIVAGVIGGRLATAGKDTPAPAN
jgi:hypothetical protein